MTEVELTREELASGRCLAALADATAHELRVMAGVLELAGGVFSAFAAPLSNLSFSREDGREPDAVDELSMRLALRRLGNRLKHDEDAAARLEAATAPFWVAVRESVT